MNEEKNDWRKNEHHEWENERRMNRMKGMSDVLTCEWQANVCDGMEMKETEWEKKEEKEKEREKRERRMKMQLNRMWEEKRERKSERSKNEWSQENEWVQLREEWECRIEELTCVMFDRIEGEKAQNQNQQARNHQNCPKWEER